MTTPEPGRALVRCMGGRWCRHAPGTCTATAPKPTGLGAPTAVPLAPAVRDPEDERRVLAIAYGLYCLEAPLGSSLARGWDRVLADRPRAELFLARARFILAGAEDRL